MKTILSLNVMLLLLAPAWGQHHDRQADKPSKPAAEHKTDAKSADLPHCPVMDEPVDFNISTMTDDGPVYFCCSMCIEKFKADPDKYAKQVATQRAALAKRERVQVTCPLSGKPIDKKVFTGKGKDRVFFCCTDCKAKYEKEPAKYAAKLAASYTYQTICPVMGNKIDPAVFTDLPTGERIYYCCAGCDKKLREEPEKYAAKLKEQGVPINVAKLKKALAESQKS